MCKRVIEDIMNRGEKVGKRKNIRKEQRKRKREDVEGGKQEADIRKEGKENLKIGNGRKVRKSKGGKEWWGNGKRVNSNDGNKWVKKKQKIKKLGKEAKGEKNKRDGWGENNGEKGEREKKGNKNRDKSVQNQYLVYYAL